MSKNDPPSELAPQTYLRITLRRVAGITLIGLIAAGIYSEIRDINREDSFATVSVSGMQHIGPNFNISTFYVNRYGGGNIGREGYGGEVCCVMLPKVWRPGLVVDLRWEVGDWSKEDLKALDAGDASSLSFQDYKAIVPVERYKTAETLFVHFYAKGKARVVSGPPGPDNPIHDDDPTSADSATIGIPVKALYSEEEEAEMSRKFDEDRKKYGDWR